MPDPEPLHNAQAVSQVETSRNALAAQLLKRRDAILEAWRSRLIADRADSSPVRLPRHEFFNHIPSVLNALHGCLRQPDGAGVEQACRIAGSHGAHRWQQGFDLNEMSREWGHLHRALLAELEQCDNFPPAVMAQARDVVAAVIHEGITGSIQEFHRLQKLEAEARARDLEAAIRRQQGDQKQRGEHLRAASHDLKGGLSVVQAAVHILTEGPADEAERAEMTAIVHSAATDLSQLLGDLLDLARLEAGLEEVSTTAFDASALLNDLCRQTRPLADAANLTLVAHGPPTFAVRGDRAKIRRIAQNLVLNALKYTAVGGVEVTWQAEPKQRWSFAVCDTGPGIPSGTAGLLEAELSDATLDAQSSASEFSPDAESSPDTLTPDTFAPGDPDLSESPGSESPGSESPEASQPPPAGSPPAGQTINARGEGIGLSIVRRLCELLDATMKLETRPGRGSTFRVILPRDEA